MAHGHVHSVAHFTWCTHPDSCYCEVNRYVLAGIEGVIAATIGWQISQLGNTYGGETNSLHDFSDGGFILFSAILALLKRFSPKKSGTFDDIGMWANNLSFVAVGAYMIYKIVFVGLLPELIGGMMFLAGLVAFGGNILQFWLLGEHLGNASDMHHSNRAHVLYDIMNSWAVMFGAALAVIIVSDATPWLKAFVTALFGLITAICMIRFGLVQYETWDKGKRFDFWVGYAVVSGFLSFVAITGAPRDVDATLGIALSLVMMIGGVKNVYRRYFPKEEGDRTQHHQGHKH